MAKKRGNGRGSLHRKHAGAPWIIRYYTHEGRRVERSTRTTCQRTAERIAAKWLDDDIQRRFGLIDPKAEAMAANPAGR